MLTDHGPERQCVRHMTADWDEPELDPPFDDEVAVPRRDVVVDLAKKSLVEFFDSERERVFYQRQIQIMFEAKFFHWITAHALLELAQEGRIVSETLPLRSTGTITVYHAIGHRYWRRQAADIIRLVLRFSAPSFTQVLGLQGELMFDAGLATAGFITVARDVRSYSGKQWTETGHDLDPIYARDGIAYGAEIKDTLSYIDKEELVVKLRMCTHFGVRPLFIARMAPKNYINAVREAGGFTLIFKYQLYPFGQKGFADLVRGELGLPTDSPGRLADGTIRRFLDWHLKTLNPLHRE